MSSWRNGKALAAAISRDTAIVDQRLLQAFASVPRERFVGSPPWLIARPSYDGSSGATYEETNDLKALYGNVSIALDSGRQLYNGAPGTVAVWLDALAPQCGERAFHVGCATGYYTAILSQLVGRTGVVVGVDVDEKLVRIAEKALAEHRNVMVEAADGLRFDPGTFDVALVSAGLAEIPALWLSRMSSRGRFTIPLTVPLPSRGGQTNLSKGIVFLVERIGAQYSARMIGGAIIFTAAGEEARDAQRRLMKSLERASPREVRSLRRDAHLPSEACWLHNNSYCLSRAQIPSLGSVTVSG
ncbi:MAG: methyltransferase domain-containing protein [Acidobacteria bacterium]|nr:methyltransferase domain-containing protein [Acidobacteriota bacterium]